MEETTSTTSEDTAIDQGPQSFKPYTGKAPLILQLIAGLMWLGGIGMIVVGVPMLFFFGLGIIPIILGILNIRYGIGIFKMRRSAYKGAMILQGIGILFNLFSVFRGDLQSVVGVIMSVVVILILYYYRERFV